MSPCQLLRQPAAAAAASPAVLAAHGSLLHCAVQWNVLYRARSLTISLKISSQRPNPPAHPVCPARCRTDSLAAAAYRRYVAARLSLCRFACQHQQTLAMLLILEVALCAAWLAIWLLRNHGGNQSQGQPAASGAARAACGSQFLVATAADPQWQAELKQPLLGPSAPAAATGSCSSSASA